MADSPQVQKPQGRKRPWWRRWLTRLGIAAGGMLVLLVTLYLLRGWLFAEALGEWVAQRLEQEFGGDFSVTAVHGSWLSDLRLEQLRTEREPERGLVRHLAAEEVVVTYDWWELVFGDPLIGVESVTGSGLVVTLSLSEESTTDEPSEIPPWLRTLDGKKIPLVEVDGALTLRAGEHQIHCADITLEGAAGVVQALSTIRVDDRLFGEVSVAAEPTDLPGGWRAQAQMPQLKVAAAELSWPEGGWQVNGHGQAMDGVWSGLVGDKRWQAEVEKIDVSQLPRVARDWLTDSGIQVPSRAVVTASAAAQGLSLPDRATVSVQGLDYFDYEVESIKVDVERDGSRWSFGEVTATTTDHSLQINDLALDPKDSRLVVAPGSWTAASGDISKLFYKLGVIDTYSEREHNSAQLTMDGEWQPDGQLHWGIIGDAPGIKLQGAVRVAAGWLEDGRLNSQWRDAALEATGIVRLDKRAPMVLSDAEIAGGDLKVTVSGTLGAPIAEMSGSLQGVRIGSHTIETSTLAAVISGTQVNLKQWTGSANGVTIAARGEVDVATGAASNLQWRVAVEDLARVQEWFGLPPEVAGQLHMDGHASGTLWPLEAAVKTLNGSVRFLAEDIRWSRQSVERIEAEVDVTPERLQLATLSFVEDREFYLTLQQPVEIQRTVDGWSMSKVALGGPDGAAFVGQAHGQLGSVQSLDFDFEQLPVGALLSLTDQLPPIVGRWNGKFSLDSEHHVVPVIAVELNSSNLLIEGVPVTIDVRAYQDAQQTAIEHVAIRSEGGLDFEGQATFPFAVTLTQVLERARAFSRLDAQGRVPLDHPLLTVVSRSAGGLDNSEVLDHLDGVVGFTATVLPEGDIPVVELQVTTEDLRYQDDTFTGAIALTQGPTGLTIQQGQLSGAHDLAVDVVGGLPWVFTGHEWQRVDQRSQLQVDALLPFDHQLLRAVIRQRGLPSVSGALAVRAALIPEIEWWQATLEADSRELIVNDQAVEIAISAASDNTGTVIERGAIDGDNLTIHAQGQLPWYVAMDGLRVSQSELNAQVDVHTKLEHPFLTLAAGRELGSGTIAITSTVNQRSNAIDSVGIRIDVTEVRPAIGEEVGFDWYGVPPIDGMLQATADDNGWLVQGEVSGPVSMAGRAGGTVTPDVSQPQQWFDRLLDDQVSASARLELVHWDWVLGLAPEIREADGTLEAMATLDGSLRDPQWKVIIDGREISVTNNISVPTITHGRARIRVDQRGWKIRNLSGRMGYAPFRVTGSVPLNPIDGDWAVEASGTNLLVRQTPQLRLRADADVQVTGPWKSLLVSGDVGITDLLATSDVDLRPDLSPSSGGDPIELFELRGYPWEDIRFDLALRDGPLSNETVNDREPVRVSNNILNGSYQVDLKLVGRGALPLLNGRVASTNTRLRLPFTVFELRELELQFDERHPGNPAVRAEATSRIQQHDVTLYISGRLDDPRIDVATVPYLDRRDALLLATTGITSGHVERDAGKSAATMTLSLLTKTLVDSLFASDDPDAEQGLLSDLTLEVESGSGDQVLSQVRGELPLYGPLFMWGEFINYTQYGAYNGGLGLRFRPGVENNKQLKLKPLFGSQRQKNERHPEWDIQGVDQALVNQIRRIIRRDRQAFELYGYPAASVSDAAYLTERYLRDAGYGLASVTFQIEPNEQDPRRVVLSAASGPRFLFGDIRLSGGAIEAEGHLKKLVSALRLREGVGVGAIVGRGIQKRELVYSERRVERMVQSLRNWHRYQGYRDVVIGKPRIAYLIASNRVAVTIPVTPGHQFMLERGSCDFLGVQPDSGLQRQIQAALDKLNQIPYLKRNVVAAETTVGGILRDAGHLGAEVTTHVDIDEEGGRVAVHFAIRAGPVHRLNAVLVSWNNTPEEHQRTKRSYVRYRYNFQSGDVLNQNLIDAGTRRLVGAGFLPRVETAVQVIELEEQNESDNGDAVENENDGDDDADDQPAEVMANLLVELQEVPARTVDIQLGGGSYDLVIGRVRYTDRNVLGSGRTLEITPEASVRGYALNTRFIDRDWLARFLGPEHRLELGGLYLMREEPTFDRERIEARIGITKDFGDHFSLGVGYSFSGEEATEVRGQIPDVEQDGFVRSGRLGLRGTLDFRDNPLLPTKGWSLSAGTAWSALSFGSDVRYLEFDGDASVYFDLLSPGKLVFALGGSAITREPLDDAPSLPVQFRLFNGGSSSVRSFDQNALGPFDAQNDPTGGLTSAHATAELRYRIGQSAWHTAMFYDVGVVSPKAFDLDQDTGQAVGVGLRFELPVGPIRVDAARGFGERFSEDSQNHFHFAIGFTF